MSGQRRDNSGTTAIEVGPVGVAVGLALVALAVLGVGWLLRGGPGDDEASTTAVAATVVPEAGTWVTSRGEPAIGPVAAPVTIVEYTDFQCGNCRQFAAEVMPWLQTSWLDNGFVNVVVRDFAILGPASVAAAEAARCAGEQGRYWAYHDALFAAQPGPFEHDGLVGYAQTLGLDTAAFDDCLASGRHRAAVNASTQSGLDQGFDGTPTYLINGMKVQGAIEIDRWQSLFEAFAADFARATEAAGAAP